MFLKKLGSFVTGALKKVGDVSQTVSKIANSPVARTISTGVGTLARAAVPLLAANPETAPIAGIADKVAKGLQSGSYLNRISTAASSMSGALT
jgi:hypothetical protein